MTFLKKTLPFILINILVSAVTVLAVLFIWERVQQNSINPQSPNEQSTPAKSETTAMPKDNTPSNPGNTSQSNNGDISIELISGMGDLNLEYMIVKNNGDDKLSLLEWSLRGAERKSIRIDSDIMLNPGGTIKIYSKAGTDSALAIYLNSQEAFWRSGITVSLHDPELVERATYTIP